MDVVRSTLYSAFGTRKIATVYTPSNDYAVIIEADKARTLDPSVLSKVYVRSNTGQQVPLDSVATREAGAGPGLGCAPEPAAGRHHHLQPRRPATRWARRWAPCASSSARSRCRPTITGQFAGTAQVFENSFRDQPLLIAAAILTIYIVLGILYESFIHPITILSGLPSASLGALLILWLFDVELTIIAMIGIILLVGIVKKNAIMMVDFAIEARARGATPARRHPRGLPAALPADHDDDHGGAVRHAADRGRLGRRRRVAPAAGSGRGRRARRLAAADALHHAGHLSDVREARRAAGRRPARAHSRRGRDAGPSSRAPPRSRLVKHSETRRRGTPALGLASLTQPMAAAQRRASRVGSRLMVQGTPMGTHEVLLRNRSQRASCTPRCVFMQTVSPSR